MGHLKMLINEQTLPDIMWKMSVADKKQWAINSPTWVSEDVEVTFGKFEEHKWKDALKVAAAEPAG